MKQMNFWEKMMKKSLCVLLALVLVVTLLPVCKSAAIFPHKAIGITVGLNFVKKYCNFSLYFANHLL